MMGVLPPASGLQWVSVGPETAIPGFEHIETTSVETSCPPSVGPASTEPLLELLLEPELLVEPLLELLLELLLAPLLELRPLELPELLPDPELLLVLSIPPSEVVPVVSSPHAATMENTKAAEGTPQVERRETIDR